MDIIDFKYAIIWALSSVFVGAIADFAGYSGWVYASISAVGSPFAGLAVLALRALMGQ